jgi:hypothetical protein
MTYSLSAVFPDPNQECTAYSYAPVKAQLGAFPTIWQPATILPNDTEALAKWQSIQAMVPTNISVKGTMAGNFSNFTPTYNPTDPDCWWTFDKCVVPKLPGLPPDVATLPEPASLGYGFDDGPNCSHNVFYNYLASQNQTASKLSFINYDTHRSPFVADGILTTSGMFYIGSNVMDWPLEAQRGLADGHHICVRMLALLSTAAPGHSHYTRSSRYLVSSLHDLFPK